MNAPLRLPLDEVSIQHYWVHGKLEHWGRWNRLYRHKLKCGSAEKLFHPSGMRELRPPEEELPLWELKLLDRAVLFLPGNPPHRQLIGHYYARNNPPQVICRLLKIHRMHFPEMIFKARCGVVNQLRRMDEYTAPQLVARGA